MSKELTPLEALEKIKQARYFVDFELDAKVEEDYKEELEIIETALKRLEMFDAIESLPMPKLEVLDDNKIGYEGCDIVITNKEQLNKDQKKLKALEIIKEKGLFWSIEWQPFEQDNDYRAWDNELYESTKLTKEEYDLLKEVLL